MATAEGAWMSYSRIEWEYSVTAIEPGTTQVTVSVNGYLRMDSLHSTNGSYPYYLSGWWGNGSATVYNNIGMGGRAIIASGSYVVDLTDSAQSPAFGLVAHHYWGSASSVLYVPVGPKKYNAPSAPSTPTIVRVSDTSQTVSWDRVASAAAPYASQQLQRSEFVAGAWSAWAGVSTITTSYTNNGSHSVSDTGTVKASQYKYRVKAANPSGETYSGESVSVFTTPADPLSVAITKLTNTSIQIQVTPGKNNPNIAHNLQYRIGDDGVWTSLPSLSPGVTMTVWNTVPPGSSVTVRAQGLISMSGSVGIGLVSGYTFSNTIPLTAPPAPPSDLNPNGIAYDATASRVFPWKHNSIDSSTQTAYELRFKQEPGGSWNSTGKVASTQQFRNILANTFTNGNTYSWEVRTWGVHEDPSAWSATATFTASAAPSVAISYPASVLPASIARVDWTYSDAEGTAQSMWEASLIKDGVTLETLSDSGTAASATFTTILTDATTYSIQVKVRDGSSLWSATDQVTFVTDFPEPPKPEIDASFNENNGSVEVQVTNHAGISPWIVEAVNVHTNPSFERSTGTVEVYRQLFTNPRLVGDGTWVEVRRNLFTNPGTIASGAPVVGGWLGPIPNAGTLGVIPVAWSQSGFAYAASWTNRSNNAGDVGANVLTGSKDGIKRTYVLSVVSSESESVRIAPNGSGTIYAGSGSVTLTAGVPQRMFCTVSLASGDSAARVSIIPNNARAAGSQIAISDIDVYEGDYQSGRNPFSGDTKPVIAQPEDFRVRWIGAVNASESVLEIERVRGLTANNAVVGVSTDNGKPAARIIPTSSSSSYSLGHFPIPTVAQSGGTMIGTIRTSGPLTGGLSPQSRRLVAADPVFQSEQPPNVAGRYQLRMQYGAVTSAYQARLLHGGGLGSGDVWWTDINLFAGTYNGPFVDVDHPYPDADLTTEWVGAVDNSETRVVAPDVATVASQVANGRACYQSQSWAYEGAKSLAIRRMSDGVNAAAGAVLLNFGSGDLNKPWTVVAVCHIPEGYDPSGDIVSPTGATRSRSIFITNEIISGKYAQAPSTPGSHLVRLIFTPTSTVNALRLGGGGAIDQVVRWDLVTIVEGAHPDLVPFSGSTQGDYFNQYSWDTVADNGTSSYKTRHYTTTPTVPATEYNQLYRSLDGGTTWEMVSPMVPVNGTGFDKDVPLGLDSVLYRVVSWSSLPSSISSDADEVSTETKIGMWTAGPSLSEEIQIRLNIDNPPKLDLTSDLYSKTLHYFAGRTLPVETTGRAIMRTGSAELVVPSVAEMRRIREMALLPAPHLIRMPDTTVVYCSISNVKDSRLDEGWYRITFDITEASR